MESILVFTFLMPEDDLFFSEITIWNTQKYFLNEKQVMSMIIVFTFSSNKPIAILLHVFTLIKLHYVAAALLQHCLVVYNVER